MHRVLGVTCSGADAFLTVIEVDMGDSEVVTSTGDLRVQRVAAGDRGDSLVRTLAHWRRVISAVSPDAVALLLPETVGRTQKPHSGWAPRCEAETLVALACGLAGVPFEHISRGAARARLRLGKLDAAAKVEPAHGKYWSHRALALYAARTLAANAELAGWPASLKPGVALFEDK
jgi:hypothetical protein